MVPEHITLYAPSIRSVPATFNTKGLHKPRIQNPKPPEIQRQYATIRKPLADRKRIRRQRPLADPPNAWCGSKPPETASKTHPRRKTARKKIASDERLTRSSARFKRLVRRRRGPDREFEMLVGNSVVPFSLRSGSGAGRGSRASGSDGRKWTRVKGTSGEAWV